MVPRAGGRRAGYKTPCPPPLAICSTTTTSITTITITITSTPITAFFLPFITTLFFFLLRLFFFFFFFFLFFNHSSLFLRPNPVRLTATTGTAGECPLHQYLHM